MRALHKILKGAQHQGAETDRHDRSRVLHSGMAMGRRKDRVLSKNLIDAANEGFPMKVDSGRAAKVADESRLW